MIKRRSIFLLSILWWTISGQNVKNVGFNRAKRTLVWPEGGSKLLVICGYGIPVDVKPDTVIVGMVFKANYVLPQNATEVIHPYATYQRKKRGLNRWDLYRFLAQALDMRGLNGKSCLLKTVCEMAQIPLASNFGLFSELIHKLFTPTTTREKIYDHGDNEYYAAQYFGKKKLSCDQIFKDCPVSILDSISLLKDVQKLVK